jgi:hypothetical protein
MRAIPPIQLYDADFYAWTRQQAMELRRFAKARPNVPLDLEHLAEEIRDLAKSGRDTAYSLTRQIIQHLLLIEHSPAIQQRPHWMDEVNEFRAQMRPKLSATIRRHLRRDLGEVYGNGRRVVERKVRRHGEEGAAAGFATNCPYRVEHLLGNWFPEVELRSG